MLTVNELHDFAQALGDLLREESATARAATDG
jgi:hypothetical protein